MSKFTPDEESMILTCIANGIPLCCKDHAPTLNAILKSTRKRARFDTFAHESLGCSFDFDRHQGFWERYLELTIGWLQRIHEQSDQHKTRRSR